jgi:CAAD domains of cyanobacterial aminoacyl-tRNA synthetase
MISRRMVPMSAFVPCSGRGVRPVLLGSLRVSPSVCRPRGPPPSAAARGPSQLRAQLSDESFSTPGAAGTKESTDIIATTDKYSAPSVALDPEALKEKARQAMEDVSSRPGFYVTIAGYAVGAVVAVTVLKAVVTAVDSLPVLPGILELIGLGYCGWFAWRFVIFKSSREELLEEIDELLGRTTGRTEE